MGLTVGPGVSRHRPALCLELRGEAAVGFHGNEKTALCPDRSDATVSADRYRQRES